MDLILIEDVPALGQIGDQVKVKDGYARNFLLPKRKAVVASAKDKRRLEHEKRIADHKAVKAREADKSVASKLEALTLTITRKVGEHNKLYGSVTASDIEAALKEQDVNVDRRRIQLPEAIKALGSYQVGVKLRKDLSAEFKLLVEAEAGA